MKSSIFLTSLLLCASTLALPVEEAAYIFEREVAAVGRRAATSLDAGFKAKGKLFFGTCADPNSLADAKCGDVIKEQFGQVTPENSMKWDQIQPRRGTFSYNNADQLVKFAMDNNKLVRGHTFVWHSQLPDWVKQIGDANTLTTVIKDHIAAVGGHFKGKIFHWDVVNEMFNEDGSLRSSVFSQRLQDRFVDIAFKAAREVDPAAKLYINDYNLDSSSGKRNGMVNNVRKWKAAGTPIDGIGTQCHLQAGQVGGFQQHLEQLASVVDEVAITELDIVNASANDYTTVVRACLAVPKCVGITVWGVSDARSWRSSSNPLLYDRSYNKKAAATAILNIL